MTLTDAEYQLLNTTARHRGIRFKILKSNGKLVPITNPNILKSGTDFVLTTAGHKQVIKDNYKDRNRTIILHQTAMDSNSLPIVSVVNHVTGTVYDVNKITALGWPTTYGFQADHMFFHPETNFLYLSVPGAEPGADATKPIICKINLQETLDELEPGDCAKLAENTTDFLDTTNYTVAKTINFWTGLWNIVAFRNGNLYVYHNVSSTTITGTFCHMASFNVVNGAYTIYWSWGGAPEHADWDSRFSFPDAPSMAGNEIAAAGYYILKSWDYNEDADRLTMGFGLTDFPEGSTSKLAGWETHIAEIALDEMIVHSADNTSPARAFRDISVSPYFDSPNWWFYGPVIYLDEMYARNTYHAETIDCSDFSTSMIEIYYEWTAGGPVHAQYPGIHFCTDAMGFFQLDGCQGSEVVSGNTGRYKRIMMLDPKSPNLYIWISVSTSSNPASGNPVNYKVYIREYPLGLKKSVNVMDVAPLRQADDTTQPALSLTANIFGNIRLDPYARVTQIYGLETKVTRMQYIAKCNNYYFMALKNQLNGNLGFWRVRDDGKEVLRMTSANSDLENDFILDLITINNEAALIASGQKIQYYDAESGEFSFVGEELNFGGQIQGIYFNGDWIAAANGDKVWIFAPASTSVIHTRSIRNWWDGTESDLVIGDSDIPLDDIGRESGFKEVQFTHSKGEASYELTFAVTDKDYLPWIISAFNENLGAPGTHNGTLEDATRIIVQRGLYDSNHQWIWKDECQVFIVSEPATAAEGYANMAVQCNGIIGALATRAVYTFTHRPDETIVTGGAMVTSDNLVYHYEDAGEAITDWATSPEPIVYVDGAKAHNYDLNTANGTVTFREVQIGTITADFTFYVQGTNEAEDIVICILRHPNEVGGVGLDDTYFTRNILGETLTTIDNLTYAFGKNNIRNPDDYNAIYVDDVLTTVGFTWDYRDGTVTFSISQVGSVITGDCTYFTIQKSGVTLREISLTPKNQNNAYDAINEVVRRVAPNYVLFEAPDGKVECLYTTQKEDGDEDLSVIDDDIVLRVFADNPMYYGLATHIISYGQAPLSELPNLCFGKTVTNLFIYAWHAGVDFQWIVDGDPATQATGGYGRWSEGTKTVQDALIAAGDTGLPLISIDLESASEVETIIIARGSQVATEGDKGSVVEFSIWISTDGSTYKRIVNRFNVPPGQNVQFKSGTNFDIGTSFRYIRINMHSLGLYHWKGHTDSQFGISEVQCFESEIIKGEAKLQDDDPGEANYDETGILKRYDGHLVHVARGGQPDDALYTQQKVDADAQFILDEFKRLLSQVEVDSPYLPATPLYSTITVRNGALGRTAKFFIEQRGWSAEGDSLIGTTLP